LACVLIVPPLFDEMNRARAMLVAVMRDLAVAGIATILPDLPGCGESVQDFAAQSLNAWRAAMAAAARHFGASHVLALRGGALVAPPLLPGWALDPLHGDAVLRPCCARLRWRRGRAGKRAAWPRCSNRAARRGWCWVAIAVARR
jgi:alpha-beta hydrolase superfamily lysophospholipase